MRDSASVFASVVLVLLVAGPGCLQESPTGQSWKFEGPDGGFLDVKDVPRPRDADVVEADGGEEVDGARDTVDGGDECEPDEHRCDGDCVPDDSVVNCGESCARCPWSTRGEPVCVEGECQFDCDEGYQYCGESCVECPDVSGATTCNRHNECVAASCAEDEHLCNGVCKPNDSPQSCGDRCSPCEGAGPGQVATCTDGTCGAKCMSGHWPCSDSACCLWSRSEVTMPSHPHHFEMALDADDTVHLAYSMVPNGSGQGTELRYRGSNQAGSTLIFGPTSSEGALAGYRFGIATLPSTGQPVIAYGPGNQAPIVTKRTTGGTWQDTRLSGLGDRSIVVDVESGGGKLYVVALEHYTSTKPVTLTIAVDDGTGWTYTEVDSPVSKKWVDLEVDSSGNAMVVYHRVEPDRESIFAAEPVSGTWKPSRVVDLKSSHGSADPDVEFSPSGVPTIGYRSWRPVEQKDMLSIAERNDGEWSVMDLDPPAQNPLDPNFEFDSTGTLFVEFTESDHFHLGTLDGGSIEAFQISSDRVNSSQPDSVMQLDSNGEPVVVYEPAALTGLVLYEG